MIHKVITDRTSITTKEHTEGETIEITVQKMLNQKTPITGGEGMFFTERKDGVPPDTDIRSDRFDYALDATDKIASSKAAKREERQKIRDKKPEATDRTEPGQTPGQEPSNK